MISNSFIIKTNSSSPFLHKKQPPSVPSPELVTTPVLTKKIYPKLFSTPQQKTRKTIQRVHFPAHLSISPESLETISEASAPVIPSVAAPPSFNPKHWTVLLKSKVFNHQSLVDRPPIDPLLDSGIPKSNFPSLKKLKKCGTYWLQWQKKSDEEERINHHIEGHIFPTIGGGVAVLFESQEKITRCIETFQS